MDDSRESDDELEVESDVDLDVVLSSSDSLPETPVPFWLRTDEEIPDLKLPPSSQDLLVPNEHLLQVSCRRLDSISLKVYDDNSSSNFATGSLDVRNS